MSDQVLGPLIGSALRIHDKVQLEEFLARVDALELVRSTSFEDIFFTIKAIGLADCLELIPMVSSQQVRGFIDLDCWRKDTFVRRPFVEWIAAFVQAGPEETVRALSAIDETLIALFMKDVIKVYEVERDEPPPATQLFFSPDNRFAVEQIEEGEPSAIAMLILDALFHYQSAIDNSILTKVRYTTRMELEETAYENRNRRLEIHGFVDYYDALSIYSSPGSPETVVKPADIKQEGQLPDKEAPTSLPALFADSLGSGQLLLEALEKVTDEALSERLAQELTALGNRILSASLVNLGEIEAVRPALEEMRDFLTIGLEHLTGGRIDRAPEVLEKNFLHTIFKVGFEQVSRLRDRADLLAQTPGRDPSTLDFEDQEFLSGLRRFKPLLVEDGRYRNFRTMADVERARMRLEALFRA